MAGNSRAIKRDAGGDVAPQIFDEAADDYQYALGTDGRQHAVVHNADGQPVDFGASDLRGLLADRPEPAATRAGVTYWSVDRVGEDDEMAVNTGSVWEPLMAPSVGGGGSGDMLRATYDTDNDGIVNAADSVPWSGVTGKPAFGTASLEDTTAFATAAQGALADSATQPGDLHAVATSGDYDDLSNKPTLGTAAAADTGDFATAAQGALADSAVQGDGITDIVALTQAEYDGLTPDANTLYVITD